MTKRRDIRREELVEERNRREDESAINITYMQSTHKQGVNFCPEGHTIVQKIGWSPVLYAMVQARQGKGIRENDAQTVKEQDK